MRFTAKDVTAGAWTVQKQRVRDHIANAFTDNALDAPCLSALGQIHQILRSTPKLLVWSLLLGHMPGGVFADSVAQPVIDIYENENFVTIVQRNRLHVTQCDLVERFVDGQEERSFRLLAAELCIINRNVPDSPALHLSERARICDFRAFRTVSRDGPFIWAATSTQPSSDAVQR